MLFYSGVFKEMYDNFIRRSNLGAEVPMSSETISFYDLFVMMGAYFLDLEKSITSIEELKDIFNSENEDEYDEEYKRPKECIGAKISNDGKVSKIDLSFGCWPINYKNRHPVEIQLSTNDDIPNSNTIGNISFYAKDDYIDVQSFIKKHYDCIYNSLLNVEKYAKILGTVNHFRYFGIKAYSGSIKEKNDNFTIAMTYNDAGEITIDITPNEEVYSSFSGLEVHVIKQQLESEEDTMLDIMKRVPIQIESLDDIFKRVINESLEKCSPPQFVKKMYPLYTYNSVSGGKGLVHF